ncbi:MAG: fumarylacetoacetate hydrolase family protein [Gammaproteobacteria bacterium]|nr:fumarylacetoacetate hydrolase family protein [Gammaproteobacteria bacterium]
MKLVRYGQVGQEKPGLLHGDTIRDLSGQIDDIEGATLDRATLDKLAALNPADLPEVSSETRLGAPLNRVGKVICVGLNYSDHAEESGMPIPAEPVLFMKSTTSICGPFDDVIIPRDSTKLDWEVELGIVIGKTARYVEEKDALDYVAGYTVVNDVSERAFQIDGTGQWVKGKSNDTFCPFGPCITTTDELVDPQVLDIWLEIDGERVQNGNTRTMIFSVAHIVSYISRHMTLEPGDLIPTGTPPGVGLGFKPPRFLKAGNVMKLGIAGIGDIQQTVVPFR